MMRVAAKVTAVGVAGILGLKLLGAVTPAIGFMVAVLMMLLKIAVIMAVGYVVLTLLRELKKSKEEGVEVEVEDIEDDDEA